MNGAYEAELDTAFVIADRCYRGLVDKGGAPYIGHATRVGFDAFVASGNKSRVFVVGLLHDAIEDSDITPAGLLEAGISDEAVTAINLLTRSNSEESYFDYLARIKASPLALAVKLADLRDNVRLERIANPTEGDIARCMKYLRALNFLMFYPKPEAA